jgi:ribosome maturation factor RimP
MGLLMIGKDELRAVIGPLLEEGGLELVLVQVVPGHRQHQLRIFVDRPGGVDVAACADLSRAVARRLEARLDMQGAYRLEVSSPGMNRPIWTLEHFRRFVGERLEFELVEPRNDQVRFRGTIAAVDGEQIVLRTEAGEDFTVGPAEIASARLDLDPWQGRHRERPRRGRRARSGNDGL